MFDTSIKTPKAILVIVSQKAEQANDFLDELEMLSETFGLEVVERFIQPLPKPEPPTYIGKGKIQQLVDFIKENEIDFAIFDDELTSSQVRNLEREMKVNIMDRSMLILEIFSKNAQTAQAKTQVELARLQYMLPRLTRMWTHLERQRGGTGTRGGAGETEIETDRRRIREKIVLLKEDLKKIESQNLTQRKQRNSMIRVSLVGYTNAGKSSIMNLLSKADVLVEDKLFATLDTTVRKMVLDNTPFLLSDTVGFIRKLPHHLIESFKSTLDEVKESDVLIHVVDISHPKHLEHIEAVKKTLAELDVSNKPTIMVFNKMDLIQEEDIVDFEETWIKHENFPSIFISVKKQINIDGLRNKILDLVKDIN